MLFTDQSADIISVSTLNRMARSLLENGLPPQWIGGEISNLTLAASGHAYFSLKDASAQVRCVMFRQRMSRLAFTPREGMQVELRGTVTLYEARGDYQIAVDTMREAGLGRLFEAYDRLRRRLAEEGLFDEAHKRALPPHPRAIGIVTSPAAAALRDVVTTLRRRMPSIPLVLYPTPVQGSDAGRQIAQAIATASRRDEVDVLIVCRGGGSIEDLWAFNEEAVARAIVACRIPVVSGVGHETDTTIADFAADCRAPTPTAAAELVSPSRDAMQSQLERSRRALIRALSRLITDKQQRLDFCARRLAHPGERIRAQHRQLEQAKGRLRYLIHARLTLARSRGDALAKRLRKPDLAARSARLRALETQLAQHATAAGSARQLQLARLEAALEAMNPHAVLSRGYAIVRNDRGETVRGVEQLCNGEHVTLQMAHGEAGARIELARGAQGQLPF